LDLGVGYFFAKNAYFFLPPPGVAIFVRPNWGIEVLALRAGDRQMASRVTSRMAHFETLLT